MIISSFFHNTAFRRGPDEERPPEQDEDERCPAVRSKRNRPKNQTTSSGKQKTVIKRLDPKMFPTDPTWLFWRNVPKRLAMFGCLFFGEGPDLGEPPLRERGGAILDEIRLIFFKFADLSKKSSTQFLWQSIESVESEPNRSIEFKNNPAEQGHSQNSKRWQFPSRSLHVSPAHELHDDDLWSGSSQKM